MDASNRHEDLQDYCTGKLHSFLVQSRRLAEARSVNPLAWRQIGLAEVVLYSQRISAQLDDVIVNLDLLLRALLLSKPHVDLSWLPVLK